MSQILLSLRRSVATITLNDPARRNALSSSMFDSLEAAIACVKAHDASSVVRIRGAGPALCAGFDLSACIESPATLSSFIHRLSTVMRDIRRLRQVVVAEVHGVALAGGCALLSACDFVCVAPDAHLGYPVHRIGVSPAVSLPTLLVGIGGHARDLTLSSELIDGRRARAIGLATHCAESADVLPSLVDELCASLAMKGPRALAATKAWLNELDGTLSDEPFDSAAAGSSSLCAEPECVTMLHAFWASRRS